MKVLILPYIKNTPDLKYLIYLYYFTRSVLLRGPYLSLKLILLEPRYEKLFGINSSKFIRSEFKEYFHYQGASYMVLFRLFDEMAKHCHVTTFVDIGSGMGRAVFVAEYYGFDKCMGIELNEELVKISNKNVQKYALKRIESEIKFITANAIQYEYKNEACVYFLFNPFDGNVLRQVLQKIKKSSRSETWFVYMNPLFDNVFKEQEIKEFKRIRSGFYTEAIIYKMN